MDLFQKFRNECESEIERMNNDLNLVKQSNDWIKTANSHKYSYHFSWLGRPIIQYPQDIIGLQEIIWKVQPDLIIETGIAHGGSLIFSASLLELMAICGGPTDGEVLGIDIEIRLHNRKAIEEHAMFRRITMIEGDSTAPEVINEVKQIAMNHQKVMVILDSNHTHNHVITELEAYAHLTSVGSYCVVFDTIIEDLPENSFPDRPWDKGNNPKTAVWEFLKRHPEFEIDKKIEQKLLVTVAPDGYLKRVK